MEIICKGVIFFSSLLVFLSTTTCAIYSGGEFENKNVKSATFTTRTFEVGPGKVASKTFFDIEYPRGHVGIKSFEAELVDEKGNSVPLYEAYLHHYFAIKYHAKDWNMSKTIPKDPMEGAIYIRNDGACNTYILPYYWGFGGEARGTTSKFPEPYALEIGNPSKIPPKYLEKWLLNIMVIDTRGTEKREHCTECRCDNFILPNNFYNVTTGIDGKPLDPSYKGGIFCCQDNFQCKLKMGFEAPMRKLALRYKITWVDWNQQQIPVRFYVLDATDRVRINGSQVIHDCQVEYTIPPNDGKNISSLHIQKTKFPMEKGGYLIYGTAHMHTGAINATLYGQDGRSLYTSEPTYGKGNEPGNEKGYVVKMSGSYPKLGSTKIEDGETVTIETIYESGFRTGVMGQMYIYLADRLPKNT